MFKLVALFGLLAMCAAAPAPKPSLVYSSPVVLAQAAPVAHVVPAVTSYSAYSSSVVHPPTVPVVHQAVPVVHTPVVHSVPVAYAAAPAFYV